MQQRYHMPGSQEYAHVPDTNPYQIVRKYDMNGADTAPETLALSLVNDI
jgi:hypothetical protein